jgi:hypothetical protein
MNRPMDIVVRRRIRVFFRSFLLLFFSSLFLAGCHGGLRTPWSNKTVLWNGKDFSGWQRVGPTTAPGSQMRIVDVNEIWQIRAGVLHCTGKSMGYIRTDNQYHDYRLHVEWRWPAEAGNSGVFVHVSDPDRVWPSCIECQLKAGSAGDFVLINGAGLSINGAPRQEAGRQFVSIAKKATSSEKPVGEWNSYDITCRGDTVRCEVNGVLQNEGADATPPLGYIALQSEEGPIEFRNIYLVPANDSSESARCGAK